MGSASVPGKDDDAVMTDSDEQRELMAAAGYTGLRGTIVLCAVLAILGAFLGSILFAILFSMAMPGNSVAENTVFGIAAGVALGIWIGLVKVRRGNLEAREHLEDREWRRLILRQHIDRPR